MLSPLPLQRYATPTARQCRQHHRLSLNFLQRMSNERGSNCPPRPWLAHLIHSTEYYIDWSIRVSLSGDFSQPIFLNLPRLTSMACAPREFRLISRYTREEMGRVWNEEGKFRRWLEVELAATETLAEAGVVPAAAAAKIRENARVDACVVRRIAELEAKVKHDVIAFTMAIGETIGDPGAARWLHHGLTSNDVVDTAQALQLHEASRLIEHGLVRLGEVLERRAREFQHTPQIGRTHGVHAEPITFGLKIANWFAENRRNLERFGHAARQMAVGKISGAVGNAAHLGPDVEASICKRLGLA